MESLYKDTLINSHNYIMTLLNTKYWILFNVIENWFVLFGYRPCFYGNLEMYMEFWTFT